LLIAIVAAAALSACNTVEEATTSGTNVENIAASDLSTATKADNR
jgi:hypothetical protein